MPDSSLLQRIAAGDEQAMQGCIETYSGLVWRLAWRMLPSRSEAEDAVQEIFVALWESCDRYDPAQGREVTFVAMIARRRLIDRVRKLRQLADLQERSTPAREAELEPPPSPDRGPALEDERERVLSAVAELPEKQRTPLLLSVRHGLSHSQIAEQTGMPLGTVKTNIRRGLQHVRGLLEEAMSGTGLPASGPPSKESIA